MKNLVAELRASIAATLLLAVLCCGVYPVVVWAVGQGLFSSDANGSLVRVDGKVAGSSLLAQGFTAPNYFHPRPSAAGQGYDAASSSGTNLGPTSKKLIENVKERVARLPGGKRPAPGCAGAGRRRDVVGERPGPPHKPCEREAAGGKGRRGPRDDERGCPEEGASAHGRPIPRDLRGAARERADAEPRSGR